jgi:hypothetical protein
MINLTHPYLLYYKRVGQSTICQNKIEPIIQKVWQGVLYIFLFSFHMLDEAKSLNENYT